MSSDWTIVVIWHEAAPTVMIWRETVCKDKIRSREEEMRIAKIRDPDPLFVQTGSLDESRVPYKGAEVGAKKGIRLYFSFFRLHFPIWTKREICFQKLLEIFVICSCSIYKTDCSSIVSKVMSWVLFWLIRVALLNLQYYKWNVWNIIATIQTFSASTTMGRTGM